MFLRQKLHEAFGADACPGGEEALKVVFAQADGRGDLFQFRLALDVFFDIADGSLYLLIML